MSFTCADFQGFLILTSEVKKTKRANYCSLFLVKSEEDNTVQPVMNGGIFRGKPFANPFSRLNWWPSFPLERDPLH